MRRLRAVMKVWVPFLLLVALVPGRAQAGPDRSSRADFAAAPGKVKIVDFSFMPQTITIPAGGGVAWKNFGPSRHTTTSDTGVWDSGALGVGQIFKLRFNTPGTFNYHCNLHGFMTGQIFVTGG